MLSVFIDIKQSSSIILRIFSFSASVITFISFPHFSSTYHILSTVVEPLVSAKADAWLIRFPLSTDWSISQIYVAILPSLNFKNYCTVSLYVLFPSPLFSAKLSATCGGAMAPWLGQRIHGRRVVVSIPR